MTFDTDLPDGAVRLYMALDEYARDRGSCFPSQRLLSERLGMPDRTIRYHLRTLETAGYVTRRRSEAGGVNEYTLSTGTEVPPANIAAPPATDCRTSGNGLPVECPPYLNTLIKQDNETRKTPLPPAVMLSQEQFDELADGFDRHLKHHRTEPRDTVLQMVMDQAQRGVFDWAKFRERHRAWCDRQAQMGWQYATITFLGWIRAGMPPPAPEIVSGRGESATEKTARVARETIQKYGSL